MASLMNSCFFLIQSSSEVLGSTPYAALAQQETSTQKPAKASIFPEPKQPGNSELNFIQF